MSSENKINWYRSPLDKAVLKELTKRSDFPGFIRITALLAMVVLTGSLAYYAYLNWSWWAVVAACYLHGTLFQFIGLSGPGHELSHYTFFKSRFWNEFFSRLTGFLTWTDCVFFRLSHTKHHQWTVHRGLDGEVILPVRISRLEWLFFFTFDFKKLYLTLKASLLLSVGIVKGDWTEKLLPDVDVKRRSQVIRWARTLLIGHVVLAGVFLYFGQWFLLVLVTFVPFYAQWLNVLCTQSQHSGLQASVPDFRLCCRSVRLNPFLQFLYCNMNYHIEHHMYAAVPFYNLPKLSKVIEHDLPKAPPSLYTAWRDILPAIRRQKTEPDYYLQVNLPESANPVVSSIDDTASMCSPVIEYT